jgi:hypothetical protein
MVDIVIFVEDKNDVSFLRDFILLNYCNGDISKSIYITEKEYEINIDVKVILVSDTNKGNTELDKTGGWAKLKGQINSNFFAKLKRENENIKFLTLFDADEDGADNISKKETDINNWLVGKDFEIERFYLPFNNNNSHNLEQLLELSFNESITDCWESFINCIVNEDNKNAIEPKSKKGKIIIYKDIYSSLKNNKNEYLSKMWNLDVITNAHLKPLKEFLDKHLK